MSNLFIIAKSGWSYVIAAFLFWLFFVSIDFNILAFIAFVALLFFVYVFRNPERELKNFEDSSILSPVDGVVSAIEELEDSEYAYRVDIVSAYFDVSLLRSPINATIKELSIQKGARVSNMSALSKINENVTLLLCDSNNNQIKITHTLAQSFAGLDIDVVAEQKLLKSSRYGLMLCGVSSIYLPKNVRLDLHLSAKLKASETLIGFFS